MQGFLNFIREQGVVGFAAGFILGGAVSKVVTAIITDIINPILGLFLGLAGDIKVASFGIGSAQILYGDLLSNIIDFTVIALVVYFGTKALGIEKIELKK